MRLIDADEFEEMFNAQIERGATDLFDAVEDALQDTPTVDTTSAVRCQNCKYYTDYGTNPWCEKLKMEIEPGFYCGFGEKYEWCNGMTDMMILGTKTDEERDFYSGIQNEEGK